MKTIEKIYKEEHSNVISFFVSHIRNIQVAEELANDVFIKFYNAVKNDQYKPEQSGPRTYLYNISKNLLIDYYRVKKAELVHIEDYTKDNEENNFADVFIGEDKTMEQKEFYGRVKTLFNKLVLRDKKIFVLRFIRGYKYKEIAEKMNMKIDTVKILISRLKTKLEPQLNYLRG